MEPRREHSAGVVLYREHAGQRLYLLLDYGRHWDFPKGHLEPGESPEQAALRELAEETGITTCQLDPRYQKEISYFFRIKGQTVHKTVTFFLAKTTEDRVTVSHEHEGFAFLPAAEAEKRLTYASAKELLRKAEETLGLG
jgi:8-oxo-dGTP pyrophosphatase MutT (NUDIX family)